MSSKPGSFRAQISKSSKLLTLRFASNIGLRLISTVVLSRLLAPDVYGVFAVVLVYMYVLEMLSDLGLRSLVLTREGEVSSEFLQTCWTISILRGAVILLLSVILGGVFATMQMMDSFAVDSPYAAPELPFAIAALGVGTLIFGFETPYRFMTERGMAFGRVTIVDLCRNLVTLIAMIALAYYLRSVWALVLGQIVRSSFHVILGYIAFPGPRLALCWDRPSVKILIDRGKWVIGRSTLTAISQSFDRIFLGFVMNSTSFGYYYIARQLIDLVPQFLHALNEAMILQVFRKLHESSLADFRRNYYRYRLVFDGVAGIVAGCFVVLSPLVVDVIFDDRYAGVAPIMQILSLAILVIGVGILQNAFIAKQRFDVPTKLTVVSAICIVCGLAYATLVLESVTVALFVVALHRLPESFLVVVLGRREGWVVVWREGIVLVIFGAGLLLGWGILSLWNLFF